jgi:predicted RNA-binding Zn ribbon-like protein
MVIDSVQEDALLELLNSTPAVDGAAVDRFAEPAAARAWQRAHGGTGSDEERTYLLRARDALQDVLHGRAAPASLTGLLDGVSYRPHLGDAGVDWELDVAAERGSAVRAVLTWSELLRTKPGRLRPCANPDCRLFLLDRSKPNTARWCSMAVCGNRMKARRHYQRVRESAPE